MRTAQFSIRAMFLVTAIAATISAIGSSMYRSRIVARRPQFLYRAIEIGDAAEVGRLLKLDPRLAHVSHEKGWPSATYTPLQFAFIAAPNAWNKTIVDRLIQAGADVDAPSATGETALHFATTLGRPDIVQCLVQLGADVDARNREGLTPLHLAAMNGQAEAARILMAVGADSGAPTPDVKVFHGGTALHIATHLNRENVLKVLLEAGADVEIRDEHGRTPLHIALDNDFHQPVVEILAGHGADLAATDNDGRIPGKRGDAPDSNHAAILTWNKIVELFDGDRRGELEELIVKAPQLLDFSTDVEPSSILSRAVENRRTDMLEFLLERGVDPDLCGADGRTALHYAALTKDADALRPLVSRGANVHARSRDGTSVLDSVFDGTYDEPKVREMFELLVEAGHRPTVLYAAAMGNLPLLRKLTDDELEALDGKYTSGGVCPLHAAVLGRQLDVVEWLVERGVARNANAPLGRGRGPVLSPLMTALSYDLTDVAILLIELGVDVNLPAWTGDRPANAVVAWGRDPRILQALLAAGADPTLIKQGEGKTVLELASESTSTHREAYLQLLRGFQEADSR